MPTPPPPKLVGPFPHVPEPYRSEKLWPAYYLAFGRLINQFGQTETTLAFHLEQFAQGILGGGFGEGDELRTDVLRALLGSKRTGDLAVSFKLCLKAWMKAGHEYSDETLAEIDEIFAQLSQVRFLRDRTAHYGVQIRAEQRNIFFRALNRYTVNDIEKTEEILFRIEDLEAAADDLKTICMRLPFALGMHNRASHDPKNPPRLPPWRYRPSSLVKRAYRSPANPQPPSPPPRAWWEKQ